MYNNPYENIYEGSNYFRAMYPPEVSEVYKLVTDACDKLEYDKSIMYYDYPDKNGIHILAASISGSEEGNKYDSSLIEVLLINEFFHRRLRRNFFDFYKM